MERMWEKEDGTTERFSPSYLQWVPEPCGLARKIYSYSIFTLLPLSSCSCVLLGCHSSLEALQANVVPLIYITDKLLI